MFFSHVVLLVLVVNEYTLKLALTKRQEVRKKMKNEKMKKKKHC